MQGYVVIKKKVKPKGDMKVFASSFIKDLANNCLPWIRDAPAIERNLFTVFPWI